jgi:hypothetical protein
VFQLFCHDFEVFTHFHGACILFRIFPFFKRLRGVLHSASGVIDLLLYPAEVITRIAFDGDARLTPTQHELLNNSVL